MSTEMRAVLRVFLRSLLIQGSWNYRTLLGTGMAWALLPFGPGGGARVGDHGERDRVGDPGGRIRGGEKDERVGAGANPKVDALSASRTPAPLEPESRWIARMAEPFNAHPFLAPVAIGALARLGQEGADPDRVRTFRNALRGPLGGLGDQFVWGAWRPFCVVAALVAGLLGSPPWAVITLFLVFWNVVHLSLRFRAAAIGVALGFRVADGIRALALPRRAERIAEPGVLVLGLLFGLILVQGGTFAGDISIASIWISGAALAFLGGVAGGAALSRWAPALLLFLAAAVAWGMAT